MATRREARVAAARLPRRADTVTTAGFRVARLPAVSLEEAGTGVAGAMLRFGWDSESGDFCSGVSTVCGADTGAAFGVFTDDLRLTVARALEDVRDFAGGRSVAGWRTVLSLGLLADAEEHPCRRRGVRGGCRVLRFGLSLRGGRGHSSPDCERQNKHKSPAHRKGCGHPELLQCTAIEG